MEHRKISGEICPLIANIISSSSSDAALCREGVSPSSPWCELLAQQQKMAAVLMGNIENIKLVSQCETLFQSIGEHALAIYDTSYYDRKSIQDALARLKTHVNAFPSRDSEDFNGIFQAIKNISKQLGKTIKVIRRKEFFLLKMTPEKEKSPYHEMLHDSLQIKITALFLDISFLPFTSSTDALTIEKLKVLYKDREPFLYEKILSEWMSKKSLCLLWPFQIKNFLPEDKFAMAPHLHNVDLSCSSKYEEMSTSEDLDEFLTTICMLAVNAQHISLDIYNKKIIGALSRLPHLSSLDLFCRGGENLKYLLALTRLQKLSICCPDDEHYRQIGQLTSLCTLRFSYVDSDLNEGLKALAPLSSLEVLSFIDCDKINFSHLTSLRKLQQIDFTHSACDYLQHLKVADFAALANVSQLTTLNMENIVSDVDLQELGRLTQLQHLDFTYGDITDSGLEHLGAMTQLQTLQLRGNNKITDEGIKKLQARLKHVIIKK